ncbi:inactive serine/threonine-protein kinase PLK5 isoform X1 [Phalacrocorax carbo]|uniref:inactive serine/threonine-protein kinase PLK5 isoform X1 n=2 Tax=Phalacrocorax carbo TaxID=9209 RepID=UPI003119DA10
MQVEREQELHGRLRHRHIVRLHGHFADRSHVYLLLEYCSRRSLADILRARGRLTEPEVRYYLRQIISGLRYLHGRGIVHRDLKLSNFLVTEKMQVKIGDLGLARQEAPAGRRWGALCGTPSYLAPEVLDRKGHGVPSDIWALGCAMYAALTGSPPFEAAHRQELYRRIRAAQYPLPTHLSPRARALIARLLAPEPAERPSLRDMLDHGFFTQGFTPDRLPPHACRSAPVFVGQDPACKLLRGAAAALARGWPCWGSPPCCLGPAGSGRQPSPCREGRDSSAGPEPCKDPLRKIFISARNRLKSSH